MYNLFVSGHTGSWNGDPWTAERSRCISTEEYTDGDIAKRFVDLDASQIGELSRFPCVFAYEAWEKAPKFGSIRDVIVLPGQAKVKVKYDLIECEGFLTAAELNELGVELGISESERGRTHWAVKDVDLYRVLRDAKGVSLPHTDEVGPSLAPPRSDESGDDLWTPAGAPRLFVSHLASYKKTVHDLSRVLNDFGFACFVAHDAIEPSREWRREIERALNSCDVLVAYVTPDFSASSWTDQEIGWVLGRGLAAIPISVDGETPHGFVGSYQAVTRTRTMPTQELATRVFRAICDAVFSGQRPEGQSLAGKVVPLVTNALGRAGSKATALQFHEFLLKIPQHLWTNDRKRSLEEALNKNRTLLSRTRPEGESVTVIDILHRHVDGGKSPDEVST